MGEIIALPKIENAPGSLEELIAKCHKLAIDSENVFIDIPHAKERMAERSITVQQILDVLRQGKGVDGPSLDTYGCWRIKLERYTAGRRVQVVVIIKEKHLEVVTVMGKGNKSYD